MGNCLNYEISDDDSSVDSFFEDEKSYKSKLSSTNISLIQDEVTMKSIKSSSNQSKSIQNSENQNSENSRNNSAPLVPLPRKVRQRRHQYFDVRKYVHFIIY